jgi:CheY-like chemotaxis protein
MIDKNSLIMIVDDMKMIRTTIKRFLTTLGYENFIEAENGKECIKKFEQCKKDKQKIEVIFLDVVMPILDGKDTLKKIRELDLFTPVVMLSSVADQNVIDECKALDVEDYVMKPLKVDTGPQILEKILAKL